MIKYFWKIRVKIGDRVQTNDGFSGKISAIEKDKIIVLYDASAKTLKEFKRRRREGYPFEGLTPSFIRNWNWKNKGC